MSLTDFFICLLYFVFYPNTCIASKATKVR